MKLEERSDEVRSRKLEMLKLEIRGHEVRSKKGEHFPVAEMFLYNIGVIILFSG